DNEDVDQSDREVTAFEGLTGEGNVDEGRLDYEKDDEAYGHTYKRRNDGFYRGDHGNLSQGGAREAHRGETLLASRGRESRCGADEYEHREQEDERENRKQNLETGGAQ